jgi:hypothetical protein
MAPEAHRLPDREPEVSASAVSPRQYGDVGPRRAAGATLGLNPHIGRATEESS